MKNKQRPLAVWQDVFVAGQIPMYALASLLIREQRWITLCQYLERLKRVFSKGDDLRIQEAFDAFGLAMGDDGVRVRATRTELYIQVLRERLAGWKPRIETGGFEHLEAAKASGHGAVLWVAHFSFNSLAAKIALSRAGFDVFHLSRPEHGFTKSSFGIRVLNPIRVGAELNHAAGRIIFDRNDPAASMREAKRLLSANKFVSITAGAWEGKAPVKARVGGFAIELSSGAPRLAKISDAPLLPVFVVRDERSRTIRVTVERPIDLSRGEDKTELVQHAAQEFADRHLPFIRREPHQWREWEKLKPDAEGRSQITNSLDSDGQAGATF